MNHTILVVDDSPTVVKFVSITLKSKGYAVITASDGMDAAEKLSVSEQPIDMIITDLNMPNLDGYGLIRMVRSNPAYSRVPIVILSSEEEQHDRERGFHAGATAYLVKPFKSQLLLTEVARLLPLAVTLEKGSAR